MRKKSCDVKDCDLDYYISEDKPEKIALEGITVEQKNSKFYAVKGSAQAFDILGSVPRLEFESNEKLAEKAVGGSNIEEWQRSLDKERVNAIGKFWDDKNNYFVNNVILGIDEDIKVETGPGDTVKIEVDPKNWMTRECECGEELDGSWFEACPNHECDAGNHNLKDRPGVIIDGQHRIRGTQDENVSPSYKQSDVLATLLPETEFGKNKQAEIFTEITTTADDLKTAHKIYLDYRFEINNNTLKLRNPIGNHTVRANFEQNVDLGWRNRQAYEIGCELCSEDKNPWKDRIVIWEPKKCEYIKIENFLATVSNWFKEGGVFWHYNIKNDNNTGSPKKDTKAELKDYLSAMKSIWEQEWESNKAEYGVPQRKGIFQVIFVLFEDVANKLDREDRDRTKENFEKELSCLEEINWDQSWQRLSSPSKNKQLLKRLLREAITNSDFDKNLNDVVSSQPEFSLKEDSKALGGKSFTAQERIGLEWEEPLFAFGKAEVTIEQGDDIIFEDDDVDGTSLSLNPSDFKSAIESEPDADKIEVEIEYSNPEGSDKETISMKT